MIRRWLRWKERSVRYLDDYFANDGRAIRVNIFYRVVRLPSPPTRGCAPLFCREPRTSPSPVRFQFSRKSANRRETGRWKMPDKDFEINGNIGITRRVG